MAGAHILVLASALAAECEGAEIAPRVGHEGLPPKHLHITKTHIIHKSYDSQSWRQKTWI
jgi:hypothetical protein